jgi:hypothetical protein
VADDAARLHRRDGHARGLEDRECGTEQGRSMAVSRVTEQSERQDDPIPIPSEHSADASAQLDEEKPDCERSRADER